MGLLALPASNFRSGVLKKRRKARGGGGGTCGVETLLNQGQLYYTSRTESEHSNRVGRECCGGICKQRPGEGGSRPLVSSLASCKNVFGMGVFLVFSLALFFFFFPTPQILGQHSKLSPERQKRTPTLFLPSNTFACRLTQSWP